MLIRVLIKSSTTNSSILWSAGGRFDCRGGGRCRQSSVNRYRSPLPFRLLPLIVLIHTFLRWVQLLHSGNVSAGYLSAEAHLSRPALAIDPVRRSGSMSHEDWQAVATCMNIQVSK